MSEKPLPCPFCGCSPERGQRMVQREPKLFISVATCMNRGCPMFCKNVNIEADGYKTITWNTRVSAVVPPVSASTPAPEQEVKKAIDEAVAQERERCARVAEDFYKPMSYRVSPLEVADAIRTGCAYVYGQHRKDKR